MFTDTHCHLNIMVPKEPDAPLQEHHLESIELYLKQAAQAGVSTIINVGTSLAESLNSITIAQRFSNVYATVGIHPCDTSSMWQDEFAQLTKLVQEKERYKIVGVGETGLDFYHQPFNAQQQIDAFKAHIELALRYDLGLVIHVRESGEAVLNVLDPYKKEIKRATIHCFTQSKEFAEIVTSWGFYIGIDAPITYPKNTQLRDIVTQTAIEHLVLETDAPFLPPQSLRGKPNHPAYIPMFAELVAQLKGVSLEQLAQATTKNANRLFVGIDTQQ